MSGQRLPEGAYLGWGLYVYCRHGMRLHSPYCIGCELERREARATRT